MSIPREPRQKMINMMYLVLTALLALNVSAEILNAFKTVNRSLQNTNTVVANSTNTIMTSLQEKTTDPSTAEKAKIWYPKAKQIVDYSTAVYNYIDGVKTKIMTESKYDPASGKDKGVDNLDVSTRILVEKGEGKTLYKMLEEYKKNVLSVDPEITKEFESTLPIDLSTPKSENKGNKTWEAAYFRMVPTIATLTILSKFQNDVKNTENKIVSYCHNKVGQVAVRFDTYAAIVGQSSSYVLPNQQIEITAGVGAFSKAAKPTITIGGSTVEVGDDGAAHQKITASSIGEHDVPVTIVYTDQEGKQQTIKETIKYTVGQSNAAVQLDKMNVLFIGVDNPITVSGSGSADKLKVSISGGGGVLNGGNGHYTARVNQETDECIVSVTTPDGKVTPVRFRVRSIPDPTPMVGQNKSGDMPAGAFKSQAGVRAIVENFFYETQFNVVSFRMTGEGDGFADGIEDAVNSGATWKEAQKIVSKARPGSFITIEDIRAVGPDGRTRKLTPLIYNLK
ncbi:MAG: gliding motility protein GldM [Bacteroidetes bacterium]|nr:gliding motility protein GldM [Bacteroidota bacterium]MBS1610971.1 gliding motility protein GldM [Bacteroidota bacterium]